MRLSTTPSARPDVTFLWSGVTTKEVLIFRLSHYQTGNDSGWVRTTGHSADPRGDQNFLGKAIDIRDGIYKCLFCHTAV